MDYTLNHVLVGILQYINFNKEILMALTTTTKSQNKKISDLKKKIFTSATYRSGSSNVFGTCPSSCKLNPYPSESTTEFDWIMQTH